MTTYYEKSIIYLFRKQLIGTIFARERDRERERERVVNVVPSNLYYNIQAGHCVKQRPAFHVYINCSITY